MEDRKIVTDEQIIKCLELCTGKGGVVNCESCLVGKEFGWQGCERNLMLQCRGLINRQKAEIERLQKECDSKEKAYNEEYCLRKELKSENESLKEAIKDLRHEMSYMINPNTIGDRHEMGAW